MKVEESDGEQVDKEFVQRFNELVEQGQKIEERYDAKIFDERMWSEGKTIDDQKGDEIADQADHSEQQRS